MTPRAIAFALALLFALSSAAVATPAACCLPNGAGDRTLVAVDCCAAMVDCPMQLRAAGTALIQAGAPSSAPVTLAAAPDSPESAGNDLQTLSAVPFAAPFPDRPPLYRLNAQLLI